MSMLELANTEDLLEEIKTRFEGLVLLGVDKECHERVTQIFNGPAYMCAGLLSEAVCQITATMTKPIDLDE